MYYKNCIIVVLVISILFISSCAHTTKTTMNKNEVEVGDVVIIQLKDESIVKMMIKEITDETLFSKKYTIQKADIVSIEKETGSPLAFAGTIFGALAIGALAMLIYGISQIGVGN